MKRIICLIFSVVLMLLLCITASAAGNSTIKGNGSATVGSNIEFTVNVSGCDDATSIAVAVNYGDEFELVSGTWLKNGSINKFDTSTNKGALGGLSSPDVNGNLFKLILKAKTASTSSKSVSVNVIAKNGSNEIMNVTSSISVKINCATHSYGNYTNANATNHSRTCSVCGTVETNVHSWNSGNITKSASCKETGVKTYNCTATGCGATKTETIAKTNNHTYGSWGQTKAPSCTGKGTESRACSTCQKVETRDISATGHKMGSWMQTKAPTCTTKGTEQRKCTVSGCSYTETRDIAATGHNMGGWKTTKEATCEAKGEQTRSCSKCSHKETKAIDALGHKFSNPTVTKQPTCTETGIETGKCTRCNRETTKTIKATGHSFSTWVDTKAATCTEKGAQEHKCSKCNTVESRETDALGHDFDKPVVIKEPTLTEKGIEEGTCKTCGEKTQAELPCAFKDETTGIEIKTDEGVFQEGTEIKIEVIEKEHTEFEKVKTALKEVGSNFVAYDVSAIRDNVVVQPNGTVTVSFKIPEGFGKNVAVFYISDDGISEKLESAISEDGKSISATLSHFSSYAVVELDAADTETNVDNATDENSSNTLWIIIAIVAVIIIAGVIIAIIFIKKKKK